MYIPNVLTLVMLTLPASLTFAENQKGSQKFVVSVPTSISITAPETAAIQHDESDNAQEFPAQPWIVKANVLNGVTVAFEAISPFVHEKNQEFQRDAQLSLYLKDSSGPAAWKIASVEDRTDYSRGDRNAVVTAASSGVGLATFALTVRFITEDYGTFASGTYETTIVGTVTAN